MIDQLTVFLENDKGRLAALARCMGDAGVNMSELSISDTADFGLVRIICDDSAKAQEALTAAGYHSLVTSVLAVAAPNRPGGLADLLEAIDAVDVNIEYAYCFSRHADQAVMAIKIADPAGAVRVQAALAEAGFVILAQEDLN